MLYTAFARSTRSMLPPMIWRMVSSLWPRMIMPRVKSGQLDQATLWSASTVVW
jgi:hypothetical protein